MLGEKCAFVQARERQRDSRASAKDFLTHRKDYVTSIPTNVIHVFGMATLVASGRNKTLLSGDGDNG
jgi:hypothetical protein